MIISWLGHSCFRLKGNRTTVITDPYSPDLGYKLEKQTAQIVTVSHPHPGHSYTQDIEGCLKVLSVPGEYEIGGVLITGIAAYHDNAKGAERGKNTIFLIEVDEVAVCHLGDLGHALSAHQQEEIGNVDVLLVPVGGVSTLSASGAAEVIRQLEPKIIIPMHYKTPALKRELEPVDKFLKEIGAKQPVTQPRLTVTKSNLPESAQVVLLEY